MGETEVIVGFVRDRSFLGGLIGGNGRGFWDHMTNYLSDDEVIDARVGSMKWKGRRIAAGVQIRPAAYLNANPFFVKLAMPCTFDQRDGWREDLLSQKGKPYDKIGILDFADNSVYDRNWRDQSAWFCDELGYWAQWKNSIVPSVGIPPFCLTPGGVYIADMSAGARVLEYRGEPVRRMLEEAGVALP